MNPASELDDLQGLDPELLYLFLCGPGRGEAMALALPGRGWILVDACKVREALPLEEIIERWNRGPDDRVEGALLTHPHDDHADGFAELVDIYDPGWIALVGGEDPQETLFHEILRRFSSVGVQSEDQFARSVMMAGKAIQTWAESHPDGLLSVRDGARLPSRHTGVEFLVRAPDQGAITSYLDRRQGHLHRDDANELSAVVELRWGQLRIVLGGDLPRYRTSDYSRARRRGQVPTLLSTGWDSVLERHPDLGIHHALKVPHHGSEAAQHPELMTNEQEDQGRAWLVTPYNSSGLPELAEGAGLAQLLARQSPISLTAVPPGLDHQAAVPHRGEVPLDVLRPRRVTQRTGVPFLDESGIEITPGTFEDTLDPVWVVAFDRGGQIRKRWRGRVALDVLRPAP